MSDDRLGQSDWRSLHLLFTSTPHPLLPNGTHALDSKCPPAGRGHCYTQLLQLAASFIVMGTNPGRIRFYCSLLLVILRKRISGAS